MIDEDSAGARARRRTWVTGGILVVLSALVGFVARFDLAWMHPALDVFWALAILVLVIGLGRAGSITGRRPIASTVVLLQALIASPLAPAFLNGLVPDTPGSLYEQEDAFIAVMFPYYGVLAVVTVAAVILIGWAGALPRPWSWAPSWVLVLSSVAVVVSVQFIPITFLGPLHTVSLILFSLPGAGVLFLGILAIVLGLRATREVPTAAHATEFDVASARPGAAE